MTETARDRLLSTALDTADSAATVLAGAAAGLTTYRALYHRPVETRLALTATAAALALCLADQATTLLRRPLRRHLGLSAYGYTAPEATTPVPAPTLEQLAADAAVDAAHRAATYAHSLDHGYGSLTQAANWLGDADGTATCELTPSAYLLCIPSPADRHGYGTRTYHLVADGERAIEVTTVAELVALLDRLADGHRLDPQTDGEEEHYHDEDRHGGDEPTGHSDQRGQDNQDRETFASCSEEPPF